MKIQNIFIKIMLPMVLIVCLSAIAILTITGRLFDHTYETQIINHNRDSSNFISQSVESFMSRAYSLTEELVNTKAILSMDHDKQTPILQGTAARNNYFELLYIQDMKGDQTARSSGELGNRANRWWFTQMLEKNEPFISKSYYSVNTNMACASIFFPMIKEGTTIGIFATDIKLATLQSLVEEFSDTESGKISYIIDGEGTVIAHPESVFYEELYNYKNHTRTISKKDGNGETLYDAEGNILTEDKPIELTEEYAAMITSVMTGNSGSAEISDQGINYYASYAPVELDGSSDSWSVITLQDKAKAMSLMNQVNRTGILITIAAVIISLLLIAFIAHSITQPIKLSHQRLQTLSEGDLTSVVPDVRGKDESAQLLDNLNKTIAVLRGIIQEINHSVQKIADGDFRQNSLLDFKGEFNALATSLTTISSSIGRTMNQINQCANRFIDGLSSFDEAAQSLADGTTSQASAVEELSSTLEGITGKIAQNAENSQNADQMMTTVHQHLEETNTDLQELIVAMTTIEENSNEISSITKLMQDIASKTNLLSMNASVEATRAGLSGKGFAVVASEIRTLAAQCNKAATDTADLIDKTRKNVQNGMASLRVTVSSIQSVSEGNDSTSQLISRISTATSEQSDAIQQISTALNQISDITQSNSATASESAQTSLQMKQRAEELKQLLSHYKY